MRPVRYVVGVTAVLLVSVAVVACARSAPRSQPVAAAGGNVDFHNLHASEPPPEPLRAGERFIYVGMPRPYTPVPPNGGTDEYRCFLIDPQFAQRTFVTGSQFLPQNADIVHHAIFFRVDPGEVAQARQLDAGDPDDGWTCFGGPGVGGGGGGGRAGNSAASQLGGGSWIAAWAPGGKETLLGARTGYDMQPGSQIVMQVHYNLLATGGKAGGADQSGMRLRVVDGSANLRPLSTSLIPAPVELPCPAGVTGDLCDRNKSVLDVWHRFGQEAAATVSGLNLLCNSGHDPVPGPTQHCDIRVRQAGVVYAVAGHMHLLGHSVKVELNPGTAQARTLLDVPTYNFDDQSARVLATPVTVKPGDTYRVTCTHDAALRTQLPQLKPLPPRYVVWGDGTADEMCLGIVIWAPPA
jgi:hypothetical protein